MKAIANVYGDLTFKIPIRTVADNSPDYFFIVFQ